MQTPAAGKHGSSHSHVFHVPKLSCEAQSYDEIVSQSFQVTEPPVKKRMTDHAVATRSLIPPAVLYESYHATPRMLSDMSDQWQRPMYRPAFGQEHRYDLVLSPKATRDA